MDHGDIMFVSIHMVLAWLYMTGCKKHWSANPVVIAQPCWNGGKLLVSDKVETVIEVGTWKEALTQGQGVFVIVIGKQKQEEGRYINVCYLDHVMLEIYCLQKCWGTRWGTTRWDVGATYSLLVKYKLIGNMDELSTSKH